MQSDCRTCGACRLLPERIAAIVAPASEAGAMSFLRRKILGYIPRLLQRGLKPNRKVRTINLHVW
ncbi:hypothetical protein Rmet_6419 [Cupriavidus metallidurans CH34]|uniref:Uncharacterized protein n=1 Tax=Cupriavidus metallidurans (strain ATCC 43123 / DSM 2839 / NBRC 102507 / CH34) TaxID=266264 RepID=D3DXL7_CUPMC|nr:hypothetical protein Rmet_6419 [Cupriavidus metallidurans CH34]